LISNSTWVDAAIIYTFDPDHAKAVYIVTYNNF